MTEEQFDRLVKRYEVESARSPAWYRLRVGLFTMLGYAYIALMLLVALSIVGVPIYLLIQFPRFLSTYLNLFLPAMAFGLAMVWLIARSLVVRIPRPQGVELKRSQAPRLFAMLDGLRSELRTPPIHRVLITPEFNASIWQYPRLGIFGWQENHLILGLPLLQILGYPHVRGVVAHELGHLSKQHSRFGQWIYRQTRTWENLTDHMAQREQRGDLITPFFEWYMPRLEAMSFALRRQEEYEADRTAVRTVGVKTYGDALCLMPIALDWLEAYWQQVYDQVKHSDTPIGKPFHEVGAAFRREWNPDTAAQVLQAALNYPTDVMDTHPSLADRLRAIGYAKPSPDPLRPTPVPLPEPPAQSAAEYLLGDAETALADRFHAEWQSGIEPAWQQQYQTMQRVREQAEALQQKAQQETLDANELYLLASSTLALQGEAHAIPLLQQALQRDPDHAPSHLLLGALLLRQNDAAGVAHLERAMELDPHLTTEAAGTLHDYYISQGDEARAASCRAKIRAYHAQLATAHYERKRITLRDHFLPHGLTPEQLQSLQQQLSQHPEIVKAYLVRKELKAFQEEPMLVLGVRPRWSSAGHQTNQLLERLSEQITYPYQTTIIALVGEGRRFEKVFEKVPDALILSR
ncbi:MAG: M48 family metalloprotease [Fimbriimonadales bacterium]|nr:M48 family metalloprotease [Fimbriimonadales bacterium]